MENLRVESGIEICVNNAGETIMLRVNDQRFMKGFNELAETLKDLSEDAELEAVKDLPRQEQFEVTIIKTKEIMRKMDEVFGENCCDKIFGDIIPVPYLITDFFDKLIPVLNKGANERQEMLREKYTDRKKERDA